MYMSNLYLTSRTVIPCLAFPQIEKSSHEIQKSTAG